MIRRRILMILILTGLCITVYLVLKSSDPSTVACSVGGCEKVLSSKYAHLFGLPLAGYGLFWYIASLVLLALSYFEKRFSQTYFKIWTVFGLVFSLYLLGLEAFVIHSYCLWCLGSLTIIALLNFVTFITLPIDER